MDIVIEKAEPVARAWPRLSFSAVIAGAILSVGLWILFHVLGLAAGLTAIEPDSPSSLRGAGIGTGIWSIIASLIALFAGGVVAAYIAGPMARVSGALHGAVLWALTTILGLSLIVATAGMLFRGAARMGGVVVSAAGSFGSLAESVDPMRALGLQAEDLLQPVNEKLREQGKPGVTPDQLKASVQEAAQIAVRQGRFERDVLVSALARNTALTRADVEELAVQIEQRVDRLGARVEDVQTSALAAAEAAGKGLWWIFAAQLLGLVAAVGGALLGTSATKRPTERPTAAQVRESYRETPLGPPAIVEP